MANQARLLGFPCILLQLFWFWLVASTITPRSNFTDQEALLTFKSYLTLDPNNTLSNSWNPNTSFCNWIGVSCSKHIQRVTKLDLHGMDLEGTISPHISNLSFLVLLNLSDNNFHGHLPTEVGNLPNLEILSLGSNQIEGTIPPTLANLSALYLLSLNNNNFRGNIPGDLGRLPNLKYVSFYGNKFSGDIPLEIFNISSLVWISFSYNSLSGKLPVDTGRFLPNLVSLSILSNQITGPIPLSLSNSSKLRELWLGQNRLSGSIPETLGDLLYLQILNLELNNLRGEIPSNIFNISSLTHVSLFSNSLSGQLPVDSGRFLPNLERLTINRNQISGSIPLSLSNASKLTVLSLSENNMYGTIPDTMENLLHLEILDLAKNNLTGTIPSKIFNLSSLTGLSLAFNQFSGHLPPDMGDWLPNINQIFLSNTRLSGQIPLSLGNASKLFRLEASDNNFTGLFPTALAKLPLLQFLNLQGNQLMNEPGTNELNFLTYFTSCKFLESLDLSFNPLRGILPSSIGNFSMLKAFYAYESQIEGTIPMEIGNLSSLMTLSLFGNNLRGVIPSTIGRLEKLQRLGLGDNKLEGSIPIELGHLRYLGMMSLVQNFLSGDIPDLFQNLSGLQTIALADNKLSGIPSSLWTLYELLFLDLSHNSLKGVLPQEVGNLKQIALLDLSVNQFTSNIPISLGHLQMLHFLDLGLNSLNGPIPESFGDLISIEFMGLSSNHLNGVIPKSLQMLLFLDYLNLSFNSLEGEIPYEGVFANITAQSLMGNPKLCCSPKQYIGLNISICSTHVTKSRVDPPLRKIIISTIVVTAFVIICFSLLIIYCGRKKRTISPIENIPTRTQKMISYLELQQATSNFSEENLIGVGSFSSVYKGTMVDGSLVAVKVLNIQSDRAWESFEAECEVMRNVRHRNLVKIITSCSNLDFRALVLQFMPNGSLDQWLYSHNNYLSLLQRIEIMIDVASAIEYLHHYYSGPVVHCDLKPSNVLLDKDMVAHVSDFGIAKLLDKNNSATQTNTLGTIGYIAPEYGLEGKVSTKSDVYSYGILLLELLTRKKPTDGMFIRGLNIRQWVNASIPNAMMDVIDINLLREIHSCGNNGERVDDLHKRQLSCMLSMIEVGLLCSRDLVEERINMKDVMVRLMKIRKLL